MTALIVLTALAVYCFFYFTYGRGIQNRLFRSHEAPDTPSKRLSDGFDYVPTSKYVLFGHHFASIAGAGPIIGPAMALAWGWLPCLLWIWIGNIFIGATHDYLALTASVRYDGRSVQFIAQDLIGHSAGKAFGWFVLFLCVLIVAAFGDIVAQEFARGQGEVASTFFLFCISAIVFGFFLYHTRLGLALSTLIGLVLIVLSFFLGSTYGIEASKNVWYVVILVYIVIASGLPVNILLQPRDYLNSFFLYFGIFIGALAAVIACQDFAAVPAVVSLNAPVIADRASPFWPTVPLVVACGALSGFHGLVSSGTSSKQLKEERDGLFVGYGAMLTEGFLGTIVVIAIAGFGGDSFGRDLLEAPALDRFVASYGSMVNSAFPFCSKEFMSLFASIWVSSFALTTLDTTNRLGRYIVSEMALPLKHGTAMSYRIFANRWTSSIFIALLGIVLAWGGDYTIFWPLFSGANQLIASIFMLIAALWVKKKLESRFLALILVPAVLLWLTITSGLVWFEVKVIPAYFFMARGMSGMNYWKFQISGLVMGLITLAMLIINAQMLIQIRKHFFEKTVEIEE